MALVVAPLEDGDVEEIAHIQYHAFRNETAVNGAGLLFSPDPVPPQGYMSSTSDKIRRAMKLGYTRFVKVVDTSTNMVIASGRWDFIPAHPSKEQLDELFFQSSAPPGANVDAWNDFFGNLHEQRKKYLTSKGTKPVAILRMLTTHPDHHRRGAGGLVLNKFVHEVDKEPVEAYVEASEAGRPLYARFGFKPIFEKIFDMTKYGGKGTDRNTIMIRGRVSVDESSG